jgi:hypothetical protein
MIRLSEIQLFQLLKPAIGEQQAEAIVAYVDARFKENNAELYDRLATKEDLAKLEGKLSTSISETKSDIQRWVFGFFFALIIAIVGLYFKK